MKQIEQALRDNNGRVYLAADALGCDYSLIYKRIQESPNLQEIVNHLRQRLVDKAERVIERSLDDDSVAAAMYVLKTQGARRGWAEQQNVNIAGQAQAPAVKIEFVKNAALDLIGGDETE